MLVKKGQNVIIIQLPSIGFSHSEAVQTKVVNKLKHRMVISAVYSSFSFRRLLQKFRQSIRNLGVIQVKVKTKNLNQTVKKTEMFAI